MVSDIHNLLQQALQCQKTGQFDRAENLYEHILQETPQQVDALHFLGIIAAHRHQYDKAIDLIQRAILVCPLFSDLYNSLGNVFEEQGRWNQALKYYRYALQLEPNFVEAHNNVGLILGQQGHLQEAIKHYQRILELRPDYITAHSNWVYLLNFVEDTTPEHIFIEHRKFDEQHALCLANTIAPHPTLFHKKLRIGYLSPDCRRHSVAYFIEPILSHHAREHFEIFCYAHSLQEDDTTERLKNYADHWMNCFGIPDEALSQRIRQDQIDILVDLAGHTTGSRLLVFARKPAPIQMTYLGYPNTTGLTAIDYRISDTYVDKDDKLSSETLIQMPNSFFCYQPLSESPPINELPMLKNGYPTFGSLNSYMKFSPFILKLWAKILHVLPQAKLVVQNQAFQERETFSSFEKRMEQLGVDPQRIILMNYALPPGYLETYHHIDIALDTYPFNGGTTTCEALWMGIPVLSLKGQRQVSRLGLSILSSIGLSEWVAETPQEYIEKCLYMVHHQDFLQHLRQSMRERLYTSPLMEASSFTRCLEDIYRKVTNQWMTQVEHDG